jgi:hypothetical protein
MNEKMRPRRISARPMAVTLLAACLGGSIVFAQSPGKSTAGAQTKGDAVVTQHASGPFDVKVSSEGTPDKAEGSTLGRMSLDKQYHGALEATGKGEMLTAGTDVKGSGAYVAIERVTGTLNGRSGSFVLQHTGTMTQGVPTMSITVVPDSGSGQLAGIAGKLTIIIENGKHSYVLDYTLPATN